MPSSSASWLVESSLASLRRSAMFFGPKSFAGLFGAAPSIALATVALTIRQKGKAYAAIEARSMIFGACAFLIYAALVSWLLRRYKPPALVASITLLPVWFAVSLGLWFLIGERL